MFEQITKFANEATSTIGDTVTEAIDAINDNDVATRFTTTSDQVLDAVLDANRRIVDAAVTTADRVAEQIRNQVDVDLPFADRLPTPTVAGERYLDFVERAVSLNRDMNQRVVEMIKVDNAKKAPAATTVASKRPAKKTAAKRVSAKKAVAKKATASK